MSITSQVAQTGPFLITGLPQVIPVGFTFQQGSDFKVLNGGTTGVVIDPPEILTLGSDYTVTGGGYNSANEMQTGSITVVSTGINTVAVGDYLVITRNVPINQTGSLISTGPLTVQLLEQAVDKCATIDQELNNGVGRSLRFEPNEFLDGTLPGPSTRANMLLGFDSNGVQTMYSPLGAGASAVGAGYGITVSGSTISAKTSVVDSIAALKAMSVASLTTGLQINVTGYSTKGDGGGGIFYYDSASAATDNGGTIIQPNVGSGRWLRDTPNNQINIRQFGAKGDGVADDTTPIAKAFTLAVATPGSYLYVPPGTYLTGSISFTGATGLTIYGDGMGVSILKGTHPTRILTVAASTSVNVRGITFDGQCVTRTAGQQAVTMDGAKHSFCFNEILNSGEFAFFAGDATATTDIVVSNNYIHNCYADGIHFEAVTRGLIQNNNIYLVDDDCIALYYNGVAACFRIVVSGNYCEARFDLGTSTGRGIIAIRATNCAIESNYIQSIKQTGIELSSEGGSRVTSVTVANNFIKNVAASSGYGIVAYTTTDCQLLNNTIEGGVTATALVDIADWQNLTIKGGVLKQTINVANSRGIHAEESAGWAASWNNLVISDVSIQMLGAANIQCIYLGPNAAVTMNTLAIQNTICYQTAAGDYINVNAARTGTLAKIVNNTFTGAGTTTTPAASAGVFIVANNN